MNRLSKYFNHISDGKIFDIEELITIKNIEDELITGYVIDICNTGITVRDEDNENLHHYIPYSNIININHGGIYLGE